MLELRNVSYSYKLKHRKEKKALDQINMEFHTGKFYTVFGVSGSGKTTCLSLLGALDRPKEGEVLLDGVDIREINSSLYRRKYVSYVFRDFRLFSYMSAMENVMTALKISRPEMSKIQMREKAEETLLSLGLTKQEIVRGVTKLSGGQMQRVALARALAVDSLYILADEPTGNLDSGNTDMIIRNLREIADVYQRGVIVVTHSQKVQEASDISYIMEDGKILEKRTFSKQ